MRRDNMSQEEIQSDAPELSQSGSLIEPQGLGQPPEGCSNYSQLLALARTRRSIRAIDPDRPVPDWVVDEVLEVARWAPSAGNAQPWEFLVIRDPETRKRISELYAYQLEEKREMQEAVWGQRNDIGYTGFRNSPVFILILGDPRVTSAYPVRTGLEKAESHYLSSLANATMLAHLAVTSLGLGSQWVSDVSSPYMSTMLKSWLDIPRHMKVYDMLGIGFPKVRPAPTQRRPLADLVHHEHYEETKGRSEDDISAFLWGDSILGGFKSSKVPKHERS
jgi:nitroreductase